MKQTKTGTIWQKSEEQAVEFQKNKELIMNEGATENLTEKMMF